MQSLPPSVPGSPLSRMTASAPAEPPLIAGSGGVPVTNLRVITLLFKFGNDLPQWCIVSVDADLPVIKSIQNVIQREHFKTAHNYYVHTLAFRYITRDVLWRDYAPDNKDVLLVVSDIADISDPRAASLLLVNLSLEHPLSLPATTVEQVFQALRLRSFCVSWRVLKHAFCCCFYPSSDYSHLHQNE